MWRKEMSLTLRSPMCSCASVLIHPENHMTISSDIIFEDHAVQKNQNCQSRQFPWITKANLEETTIF